MKTNLKRILQSAFSFLFILMTIGFGHIFMITLEHFDTKISYDEYNIPGSQAILHADMPMAEELKKKINESISSGNKNEEMIYRKAYETLNRNNGDIHFRMLPVSAFMIYCALASSLIAMGLLLFSRYLKNNTSQTIAGIFAGLFSWITVEHSLIMASRQLGIARRLDIFNGGIIGIRGEYVLMKYSWAFVLIVLLYLLFQESVRCNMVLFIRRRLHLMRGATATGKIDNYAPRVAFFFTSSIWTFYVVLLLAYDERIFGVNSWFTYLFFFICCSSSVYLFYRLIHQGSFGAILRYSIGAALLFWSVVEILEKWWGISGPWHSYNITSLILFISALLLGVIFVVYKVKKDRIA